MCLEFFFREGDALVSQLDVGWQGVPSPRSRYRKGLVRDAKPCPTYSRQHVSGAWADREWSMSGEKAALPISATPAPRSVPAPRPPAPRPPAPRSVPLHRFLQRPLTAPLCSTRFSARSAPFSAPLMLRSYALTAKLPRDVLSCYCQLDGSTPSGISFVYTATIRKVSLEITGVTWVERATWGLTKS